MLKLLHTADLHLDAPLHSLGPLRNLRREDFLNTFKRIVELALAEQVDLFLVAGDLFDVPNPSSRVLGVVRAELARLAAAGVTSVLLPGTHDGVYGWSSIYRDGGMPHALVLTGDGVPPLGCRTVKGEQVHLYGGPYRGEAPALHLAGLQRVDAPGYHIGLLHGALEGSPEWDYREKDLRFTLDQTTAWDLDYLALGHYHRFQTLEISGRCLGCYPGTPEGKRFGENGERYVALVEVSHKASCVRAVAVQSRRLDVKSLDLSHLPTYADVVAAVNRFASPDLLLRLKLTGSLDVPLDTDALQAECEDGFFQLQLQDRTHCLDSDFARRLLNEQTIRGACLRRCRTLMEERPEDRDLIEMAWRELLSKFQTIGPQG